ncbi:MAG: hypothetical protein GX495_13635 [Chloroflexi bacterium]|nr:hypothetical protein [Chloroflexota bacterium]
MICPTCGIELQEDQVVCQSCGQNVKRSSRAKVRYSSENTDPSDINVWGSAVQRTRQDGCILVAFILLILLVAGSCAGLIMLLS